MHDVYVEVANSKGIYAFQEWSFTVDEERLYAVEIRAPTEQTVALDAATEVVVAVQSNRDFPRLVMVNQVRAHLQSQAVGEAIYRANVALLPGVNTLTAVATFADDSTRTASRQLTYEPAPVLTLSSPQDWQTFGPESSPADPGTPGPRPIVVAGSVSRPVGTVSVNQQPATLSADRLGFALDP